jgi:hypothetical protein
MSVILLVLSLKLQNLASSENPGNTFQLTLYMYHPNFASFSLQSLRFFSLLVLYHLGESLYIQFALSNS